MECSVARMVLFTVVSVCLFVNTVTLELLEISQNFLGMIL